MSKNEIKNMLSLSCFLRKCPRWNILTEWYSSNIDKILEKTCKGVYFFSEVANYKPTALLKKYVLHSYFGTILLNVWVTAYCI